MSLSQFLTTSNYPNITLTQLSIWNPYTISGYLQPNDTVCIGYGILMHYYDAEAKHTAVLLEGPISRQRQPQLKRIQQYTQPLPVQRLPRPLER